MEDEKLLTLLDAVVKRTHALSADAESLDERTAQDFERMQHAADRLQERLMIALEQENDPEGTTKLRMLLHDLRAPLNTLVGFAEILLTMSRAPLTEAQRDQIQQIRDTALILSDTIDLRFKPQQGLIA